VQSPLDLAQPAHGGNLDWAASLAGCSPLSLLDFSASINPLGPPDGAIAAIHTHLSQVCHYPDPNYTELRQILGLHLGIDPNWILPGNGAAELLTWAGRDLAAQPLTYLPVPSFGDYRRSLHAFGATIQTLPLPLAPSPTPAIAFPAPPVSTQPLGVIINNPHNPTGYLFGRESLRPWLDSGALVVVDEAFMDFLGSAPSDSVMSWVADYPNLVVIGSLTKFYSIPGLRLGYAIAHPDRLRRWQQWRDPWSVNSLAVAAAIASLHDTAFQQRTWAWLPPARSHLYQSLAAIPGLTPFAGAANYLLVHCRPSSVDLQRWLLTHHQILIRDCMSFAELGDRYFRVAVRTTADNQRLIDALRCALAVLDMPFHPLDNALESPVPKPIQASKIADGS